MSHPVKAAGLLLVIITLAVPLPAQAQETIRFGTVAATGHFPREILFSVVAESESEIAKLELSYHVVGSPYTQSRWPDFASGRRVEASFRLDTQVEFYPPGSEFHYYWTATGGAGNVVESLEQVFAYDDDRFTWRELSTDRVAVYWYEGDRSFGQAALDTAMGALDRLEHEAGVQAQHQVRIYLYGNAADFRGALGPNAAEWIGGQTWSPQALIVANISPEEQLSEVGRIIPHEISHVVLYQATHNPYADNPTWLEEGIAVHNQEVPDAEYPILVEDAAREGRLIPLRALSASLPSDPDLAVLTYAESSSIIEFILQHYDTKGLSALVKVFSEGETAEAGVQRALGISLDELDAEWRATLPAAERTPIPGVMPTARSADRPRPEGLLVAMVSGTACMFFIGIGVVVAAMILLVRRRGRAQPEEEPPPGWQ